MFQFIDASGEQVLLVRDDTETIGPWPPVDGEWKRWVDEALLEQPEPTPFMYEEPVPAITPRQLRLWLVRNGHALSTVTAVINTLPEPQKTEAQINWEYAVEFLRTDPLLIQLGQALGITPAQIDQGMRDASLF